MNPQPQRKIIHIDMDCFYAAIEIRDNPELQGKPVAVGGAEGRRGVLCTCNYVARQFGIHSAMPSVTAKRKCKDLIILPVNMNKYREASKQIHEIFQQYSSLIEPLSLDEAFIDVTGSEHFEGSATLIAQAIRTQIFETTNVTASAGVAPNKFLAKIASDWKKPNGLFVIRPENIASFVETLPVKKLFGVGKVTAKKLHDLDLHTCADLQALSLEYLSDYFGKFGKQLYNQCRGIDDRPINNNRIRKSLSVETTFSEDISDMEVCLDNIKTLHEELIKRLNKSASDRKIKTQVVKIKFSDFTLTTSSKVSTNADLEKFLLLFREAYSQTSRSIRLLGVGVQFADDDSAHSFVQQSLF